MFLFVFSKNIFLMDFHPSTFFCRHDGSTPSRVTQRSLSQATTAMVFSRTQTDSMSSVRPEKEASKCFNICIILGKCSGSTLNLRSLPPISIVPPFTRRLDPELKLCVEVSPATSNFSSQSLELALPPSWER